MDGEVDELRVFDDKILDGVLLQEVISFFLHEQTERDICYTSVTRVDCRNTEHLMSRVNWVHN